MRVQKGAIVFGQAEDPELTKGIKVESEHRDIYDAMKAHLAKYNMEMPWTEDEFFGMVAKDHLREMKDYYTRLAKMESGVPDNLFDILRRYLANVEDNWGYVTPQELQELRRTGQDKHLFLLDIRKPADFAKGHIPGASNIFWLDLLKPENLAKLPRNKTILLYCYLGHTSSQALVLLKLLGYNVMSLKFGMGVPPKQVPVAGWVNLGFETTTK